MSRLFGKKLRHLRKQCGMSQSSFAHLLGLLNQSSLSNLESGRRPPSLDLVVRTAEHFYVQVDYLIRDSIQVDSVEVLLSPVDQEKVSTTSHKKTKKPSKDTGSRKEIESPYGIITTHSYRTTFGVQLRTLRQSAGLTQADLARELGLTSHAHISFLESDQKDPSIELLLRIAERFGVTADSLVRGTAVEEPLS